MGKRLDLFVFIDAFGWELLENHAFLEDVAPYRNPVETVFGYSATCIPTILTGRMPREHGHFSFFYYAPDKSPFRACRLLGALPSALADRGRVRRMMSKALARWYGFTGYFQIYGMPFDRIHLFDYSEKRDLYQPGGINGGCPTIFDHWTKEGIPYFCSDWREPEGKSLAAMTAKVNEGEIRAGYLYFAALDGLLHLHGTEGAPVAERIRWYDRELRGLLAAAHERYDDVDLHVFSDHGMHDITETLDLIPRIEALGLRFGHDYAAVYDSTMARFWFFDDRARTKITACLEQQAGGRILQQEDLIRYGADFPNKTYGDLFFLLEGGVLLCPSFLGSTRLAGMHGYAPEDRESTAMYTSSRAPVRPPERLDDHFGIMAGISSTTSSLAASR